MPDLRHDELFHRQLHRRHGARHRENDDPVAHSADRAAEHRRRADLVVAQHAKQFAVAGHRFRQEAAHGFERLIAGGDARGETDILCEIMAP